MIKVSEMEARGSKSLVGGQPLKEPSWLIWTLMKLTRIIWLTAMFAGLGMGLGLLFGILGVIARAAITHAPANLTLSYRAAGFPAAIVFGGCALVWNLLRTAQACGVRVQARRSLPR
jgi:hypothetical protein